MKHLSGSEVLGVVVATFVRAAVIGALCGGVAAFQAAPGLAPVGVMIGGSAGIGIALILALPVLILCTRKPPQQVLAAILYPAAAATLPWMCHPDPSYGFIAAFVALLPGIAWSAFSSIPRRGARGALCIRCEHILLAGQAVCPECGASQDGEPVARATRRDRVLVAAMIVTPALSLAAAIWFR